MYITLPSNSSKAYFPKNTASNFFTQLPQPLTFGEDYEVGLAEIQFDNTYANVRGAWFEYERYEYGPEHPRLLGFQRVEVPDGLFDSNRSFASALNAMARDALEGEEEASSAPRRGRRRRGWRDNELPYDDDDDDDDADAEPLLFSYNPSTKRMALRLSRNGSVLRLGAALQGILGAKKTEFRGPCDHVCERAMDVGQRVQSLFVYSDLAAPRTVGDRVVPLLRTLPPTDKRRDMAYFLFENPHYVELARNNFDTIHILLTSDKGEPISFESGQTIATLHFRRKRLV